MGNENKAQILSSILDPFFPSFGEEANVQSARQQKIGSTALWINVIWMQISLRQMSCRKMYRLWNLLQSPYHNLLSQNDPICFLLSLLIPASATSGHINKEPSQVSLGSATLGLVSEDWRFELYNDWRWKGPYRSSISKAPAMGRDARH